MENASYTLVGAAPILLHNIQLADPLNPHTRAVAAAAKVAKKNKTDASYLEMAKAEFMGGLYLDDKLEPCLPGEVLEAMIKDGARKTRQGKEVGAGVYVEGNWPLLYKGPRSPEKLWGTGSGPFVSRLPVRVGQNRVLRTRPMFTGWSCTFNVFFNPALVNRQDLRQFITKAGVEVGVGDNRPRYGRFEVADA